MDPTRTNVKVSLRLKKFRRGGSYLYFSAIESPWSSIVFISFGDIDLNVT